jgi:tetratricopeptide (TPR) repeat protein
MKKCMNVIRAGSLAPVLTILLSHGAAGAAEKYAFRVVFEEVPGVEHLVAGQLAQGIRLLERDLAAEKPHQGHVLATLCGAYLLRRQLDDAERTCAEAVARFPGETAYNNRGVLRAFQGDLEGARRDFARASPANMEAYMEVLRTRDVGLVASSNQSMLQQLSARHTSDEIRSSHASVTGAEVETIDD